jgi:hypothetical protein
MTGFLLLVNYDGGVVDTPMLEWERSPQAARASRVGRTRR